jgi:hypothetical protein
MSKAELDELNRVSKQFRQGHNAPPEQLPQLTPDGRDAATPPPPVGEQIELF